MLKPAREVAQLAPQPLQSLGLFGGAKGLVDACAVRDLAEPRMQLVQRLFIAALALFDPAKHDVVITDLGMPRMNGWEVAERVKTRSATTAVFILTGWGESVSAHESSQFVDRVIAKPVSAESLLEQLAGLKRVGASST